MFQKQKRAANKTHNVYNPKVHLYLVPEWPLKNTRLNMNTHFTQTLAHLITSLSSPLQTVAPYLVGKETGSRWLMQVDTLTGICFSWVLHQYRMDIEYVEGAIWWCRNTAQTGKNFTLREEKVRCTFFSVGHDVQQWVGQVCVFTNGAGFIEVWWLD